MLIAYEVAIKNMNGKIITRCISTDYIDACNYFDKICKTYDVPILTEDEHMYDITHSRILSVDKNLELYTINIYENYETV